MQPSAHTSHTSMSDQPPSNDSYLPVVGLGITQLICYGTLYYAFAILEPEISKEFGWPSTWTFGCFSVALLVGGLFGPIAGRFIDRQGARNAMAIGSIFSALALIFISWSTGPLMFAIGLIAIEVASTMTLYDAAFAGIAQIRSPQSARKAITQVTIFGGFASTVFWPTTHFLNEYFSWREIYLAFAAIQIAVCLPIHWTVLKGKFSGNAQPVSKPTLGDADLVPESSRFRSMLWLVSSFCLSGFVFSALNVHWVVMFEQIGLTASVAIAAGALMGPAQVGVRILDLVAGTKLRPLTTASIALVLLIAAASLMFVVGATFAGAVVFAILFGLSQGLTSIVRGTVPLALFGPQGYGARLGNISAIRLTVTSVAPFVFAFAVQIAGGWIAMTMTLGLAILALICLRLIPQSKNVPEVQAA